MSIETDLRLPKGLAGERALMVAVIRQAVIDFNTGPDDLQLDAAKYFVSDYYRQHLAWLGLPEHWLPVVLDV